MLGWKRLSVRTKLQILLSAASLVSIAVIGVLGWQKTRESLTERIAAGLTDIRAARARRIEDYFRDVQAQIETLTENPMVVTAMVEFDRAFEELRNAPLPADGDRAIETYYTREFLPRLAKKSDTPPVFETYRPLSPQSRYLQYHYIARGTSPGDDRAYGRVHARYQTFFRDFIRRSGYDDLFFIDAETGDIVYSVAKNTDFATDLYKGPYRNTNLSEIARFLRDNPDRGTTRLVDFQFYRPADNAPTAFVAASIYEGARRVGILAIALPNGRIDRSLADRPREKESSLENKVETYLVGEDYRLRSIPTFYQQNPTDYQKILQKTGVRPDTLAAIERARTPLLRHEIETPATREALTGRSDTRESVGYRGTPVLSSHAPLDIRGVNWGIVSEIDRAEAYRSIEELRDYLFLIAAILMSLVTLYAAIAAGRFLKPIERLNRHSRQVLDGAEPLFLDGTDDTATDELARLQQNVNGLIGQIRDKNDLLSEEKRENRELLLNILPKVVGERWRKGERRILDRATQVTIVCLRVNGLEKIGLDRSTERTLDGLNDLIAALDERGANHDLERLNCFGERYITSCGLTRTHLDHCKRSIEFALDSLELVKAINRKHGFSLTPRLGIHTGEVMAAVLGERAFHYDIWGNPLRVAGRLEREASANQILVTEEVRERVADLFPFEKGATIALEDGSRVTTWVLGKSSLQGLIKDITADLDFDGDYI